MSDKRAILITLADLPCDDEAFVHHDQDYRRGCDQTVNILLREVARMADKAEIVRALQAWVDVIGEMRYEKHLHLMFLHEAAARVAKRAALREGK